MRILLAQQNPTIGDLSGNIRIIKDVLDKSQSDKPDLIVMDIIMPEKEGIETIREIKRDFPSVKIIAISGGGTLGPEHYLKVALAIGADKALKKPFRTDLLVGSIEELLS